MTKPRSARRADSITVTLHSQSGAGYSYRIETPLNAATCWRRGDRHSVHAYVRELERKLNERWINEGKLATGYGARRAVSPRRAGRPRKALQLAEKNEDF